MRDPQRSRVYAWEEAVVAPRDPSAIPYEQAQMLVDGVWLAEQLLYPPAGRSHATSGPAHLGDWLAHHDPSAAGPADAHVCHPA